MYCSPIFVVLAALKSLVHVLLQEPLVIVIAQVRSLLTLNYPRVLHRQLLLPSRLFQWILWDYSLCSSNEGSYKQTCNSINVLSTVVILAVAWFFFHRKLLMHEVSCYECNASSDFENYFSKTSRKLYLSFFYSYPTLAVLVASSQIRVSSLFFSEKATLVF